MLTKILLKFQVFLFLIILVPYALAKDSADIIVVLDQSGSIAGNMPIIKEYIKKSIFGKITKEEDNVYIFSFDGEFYFKKTLKGNSTEKEIDAILSKINPVGMFTDLTNAVESMTQYIQKNASRDAKKIVFFLTDGINDPPPSSFYKEGLNHTFFKETSKIVKTGSWRVFVTGIGDKTDAPRIANLVGAEYVELSPSPTLSEFDRKLTDKLKAARRGYGIYIIIAGGIILIAGIGFWFFYYRR